MEEWVGGLWDRLITKAARRDHPEAAVHLAGIEKILGVVFRALGGDAGLRVASAADTRHGARRRWLERIAGTGEKAAHATLDMETLRLPSSIAWFPEKSLNRDLYFWLAAIAAHEPEPSGDEWIARNQIAVLRALTRHPGLEPRYRRLVNAVLADRIAPDALPADEAGQERAVRAALLDPGSVAVLPPLTSAGSRPLRPVPLWLYPAPPAASPASRKGAEPRENDSASHAASENRHHRAERTELPENESPFLLMFRAESLLSWAEYVKVNRDTDEDDNPGAARTAENMDSLHLAPDDGKRVASKVRFDLDLPAAAEDDLVLEDGILLPEWDWRRRELKTGFCRLQTMTAREAEAIPLPDRLRQPARKLRSQFAALAPARRWSKAQPEGSELDIDACVLLHTDRLAGRHFSGAGAYLSMNQRIRDLACLVLADLSLSTDAWVSDEQRVIDVIRDSLMLFGEALTATGDAFAFHGFSSLKRSLVRFHAIKDFDAPMDAAARGRIAALKPGYYTRMGAAVRHATSILERQPAALRLLLILSDGKPHDIDLYEGRYGIEDTRHALIDARRAGLKPFCVTIDHEGAAYLPHLFGPAGFTVLRKPEELPLRLPLLYAQLTG
ncbi:MAG: nitric oxide reductase [Candidatus Nitricoxidivorans perseverans]|uniref:Nitric oxide reductase n=1 Tax=Candidatus Nitricoxidivorans perseverans TaxID=2975601 RepID=A0AA49FLB6_9PROT|nr:MAG: nitric oxide reductase [Candidatus Nitricoxidivorans perseverans]